MPTKTPTKTKAKTPPPVEPAYKTWVDRTQVILNAQTQTRPGGTDPRLVEEYRESREAGVWEWMDKPAVLFLDKNGSQVPAAWKFYPGDGHHRIAGEDEKVYAIVYEGTARDARLYSLTQANKDHGLYLSKDDRKHHANLLLQDPEWAKMSDRVIAKHTGLSHPTIANIRAALEEEGAIEDGTERTGSDGKTRAVKLAHDLRVGDWVEAPLMENPNQKGQGYIKKLGKKYLIVMNDGTEYKLLATDAQRFWSPPEEIAEYVELLGKDRNQQIFEILHPHGWDDLIPGSHDAKSDGHTEDYRSWAIWTVITDYEDNDIELRHSDYDTLGYYPIPAKELMSIEQAIAIAKAAIDLVEDLLPKLPIHPIRDASEPTPQPENLPVANGAESLPEATQRPSREIEKKIKEVDNEALKDKPKDKVETPDEFATRLRLLINQATVEDVVGLACQRFGMADVTIAALSSGPPDQFNEFAKHVIESFDSDDFVEAFSWRYLAGVVAEVAPPKHLSSEETWGLLVRGIAASIGRNRLAELIDPIFSELGGTVDTLSSKETEILEESRI